MIPYQPPFFNGQSFNCPHCNAYSHQIWHEMLRHRGSNIVVQDLLLAHCCHCQKYSLWLEGKIIYPEVAGAAMPNPDLPEDVKGDYMEARSIVNKSPRGAAALLRLSIQKLCKHLGESGENINNDIANLVAKGLSPVIQKSLDIVRVIGNNAVHPGQLDLKDDVQTATQLFALVNLIAQTMITDPKEVEKLYGTLPENLRKSIEERDKAKP